MKYFKVFSILLMLGLPAGRVIAQLSPRNTDTVQQITWMLPDGTVLPAEKMDSLEKAWGKGRISFRHNKEDDAKGIMHLVQVTDEMLKQEEERKLQRNNELVSLLNQPAPGFELKDIKGKTWSLKDLRGKIVILNFWFTSCIPCIQEMPELNKLVADFKQEDVVFLGLTFNDADQVSKFVQHHSFDFTVLPASQAVDELYKISTWPTSILIDKEGYIRRIVGSTPKILEELRTGINSVRN